MSRSPSSLTPFRGLLLGAAAIGIAAGMAVLLPGCGTSSASTGDDADKKNPAVALPVRTAIAANGVVVEALTVQGRLEVWRHELLTVQVAGIIGQLPFQSNQAVKSGDVIAMLAPTPEDQDGDARSKAKLERARRDLARRENLAKNAPETISSIDLDAARDLLADALLDQAMYHDRESKRTLMAPFAGVLINLTGTVGQRVDAGFLIGEVLDTARYRLGLDVPETNLRRMRDNQVVEITALADGMVANGSISILPHAIDALKGSGHVLVDITKPPPSWRPGGFVTARLVLGETASDLVISRDSVLFRENRPYVWVAEEHEGKLVVRRAWVELGPGDPTHLSIVKGINPGDQVVTEGMAGLSDGIPVALRNDDPSPGSQASKPLPGAEQAR
jgi:RND family efflux transporter MFP subunit